MSARSRSAGTIVLLEVFALACASPRTGGASRSASDPTVVSEDTVEIEVDAAAEPLMRSTERTLRGIDARDVNVVAARHAVEAIVDGSRVVATAEAVDASHSKLRVSSRRYGFPDLDGARRVLARLRE